MVSPRIRRTAAAFALVSSLGLLGTAEAGLASRPRREGATLVQREAGRTLPQALLSLLSRFWAKAGAKIDGNG